MRIAYFTDTYLPQINGVTNTLSKLTAYLDNKEELSYKIFAPDFNEPSSEHQHENVERFYSFKFFAYPECRLSIPNFIKLYAALDAFKPDIIHSVTEINMGLAGIKYAMDRKIPLITTFTTNFPEYMKFYNVPFLYDLSWHMMRKVHNQSQLCLCPSNETKKLLESNGVKNVGLWGRGIDYEKFKPLEDKNEVKARYGISGKIMLLYVGRVSNEKNIDLLILAYQQLKKIYGEKLALVIVGGGPRLDDLTKKNPDIIFTGYLKNKELTDLYGGADIFSFPSSTETLGNVVLEAMASGVPVVGPSAGGLKDNIIDGYNGIMVEPNHLESFFQGIKTLIDEDEKRIFMSQNARKYAETKSWTSVFDHLILHYTNLLEQFKLSDIA